MTNHVSGIGHAIQLRDGYSFQNHLHRPIRQYLEFVIGPRFRGDLLPPSPSDFRRVLSNPGETLGRLRNRAGLFLAESCPGARLISTGNDQACSRFPGVQNGANSRKPVGICAGLLPGGRHLFLFIVNFYFLSLPKNQSTLCKKCPHATGFWRPGGPIERSNGPLAAPGCLPDRRNWFAGPWPPPTLPSWHLSPASGGHGNWRSPCISGLHDRICVSGLFLPPYRKIFPKRTEASPVSHRTSFFGCSHPGTVNSAISPGFIRFTHVCA